ncbi:MAG: transposase [Rickettsiales bacterium]|nr:transposase [Rickettsiales bacterium]
MPDHSTLSKTRDSYGEEVFESVFGKVVEICKKHGLVKGETIITDSTLIEADASIDSMVSRSPDLVTAENTSRGKEGITAPLLSRKLTNKTHISSTDPESTLAKKAGTPQKLKYKVHTSINAENRIILDNKVTTGSFHETNIYVERLNYIEEKYQLCIREAIADRAYGSADNIFALRKKNISAYIQLFSTRSGQVTKVKEYGFIYEAEHDR